MFYIAVMTFAASGMYLALRAIVAIGAKTDKMDNNSH